MALTQVVRKNQFTDDVGDDNDKEFRCDDFWIPCPAKKLASHIALWKEQLSLIT